MNTNASDAFKAARAKWASPGMTATTPPAECSGESQQMGASSSTAVISPHTFQVGTEIGRMASAMERIADAMPALILTLERSESTLSRIADSSPLMASIGQISATAPMTSAPAPMTNATAPMTSAPAPMTSAPAPMTNATAPMTSAPAPMTSAPAPMTSATAPMTSAPAPMTSAPAPMTSAPAPMTSVGHSSAAMTSAGQSASISPLVSIDYNFDYGVGDEVDSEDGIDPFTKCGVCRGPPEKIYALDDCGHYPYCEPCIIAMTKTASALTYKFKCPCCNGPVINPFVLQLVK